MVLPIDDCDSRPVGISRRLNAQIALVALSKLQHPLICFRMLGMVHVSVDRCENDCVVGGLGVFEMKGMTASCLFARRLPPSDPRASFTPA